MKTTTIDDSSYKKLLQEILKNEQETSERITRSKIEMCWNIGKLVENHLLENNGKSYGDSLVKRLEQDAKISYANLYRMRNFYKAYPEIPQNNPQLNWSHYKILANVSNEDERNYLEDLTKKEGLTVVSLNAKAQEIKSLKLTSNSQPITKLAFNRGRLFTYPVIEILGKKFLDLGFKVFERFDQDFAAGDILESHFLGEDEFSFTKLTLTRKKLHTYKAFVERVVDGDTINVVIDLGFNVFHKEIIRLAKINAPEKGTKDGEKATKTLKEILSGVENLVIKTIKTDIYGRYVADIFLENAEGEYLNQMLIDRRVAEVY
jgi:hypothetical protein